jgi:hypothetical protein
MKIFDLLSYRTHDNFVLVSVLKCDSKLSGVESLQIFFLTLPEADATHHLVIIKYNAGILHKHYSIGKMVAWSSPGKIFAAL